MPLLLKILGVKAIGTIVGAIILLTKSVPSFTTLTIEFEDDSLVIETSLKKGFNKGLDEIIMSGSEVIIFYTGALHEKDPKGEVTTIAKKRKYRSITFHPAENKFYVSINPDSPFVFTDFEKAKTAVSLVEIKLVPIESIKEDNFYSIKIDAVLNTIEIEAIDMKEFDLNAFWNFRYPSRNSEWVRGKELLKR